MKTKLTLEFNVDTCALLQEMLENMSGDRNHGVMQKPVMIFKNLLAQVAERAIKINDPELNILMLRLKLYECKHSYIQKLITEQKKLIKNK